VLRASKTVQILDRSFGHLAFIERAPHLRTPSQHRRYKKGKLALTATQRGKALRIDAATQSSVVALLYFKAALLFRFASKARWAIIDQLEALSDAYTPRTPENS
jgi:hypothetical protein